MSPSPIFELKVFPPMENGKKKVFLYLFLIENLLRIFCCLSKVETSFYESIKGIM